MGNVFFSGGGNGVFAALEVFENQTTQTLNRIIATAEDAISQLDVVREMAETCTRNTEQVIACNENVNAKYNEMVSMYDSARAELETIKSAALLAIETAENSAVEHIQNAKDGVLEYVLDKIETTRDSVLAIAMQAKEYAEQAKESAEEIAEIFGNKNLQFKIVNTFDVEIPEEWIEEMEYKRGVTLKDENGDELLADFVSEEGEVLCDTTSVKWKNV